MIALVRLFPGQRFYIPWRDPAAIQRFTENFTPLIGAEAVAALLDEMGCERIVIPTGRVPQRAKGYVPVDVDKVVKLTRRDMTALEISRELQCDPRSVHKARTKARDLGLLPPQSASARTNR